MPCMMSSRPCAHLDAGGHHTRAIKIKTPFMRQKHEVMHAVSSCMVSSRPCAHLDAGGHHIHPLLHSLHQPRGLAAQHLAVLQRAETASKCSQRNCKPLMSICSYQPVAWQPSTLPSCARKGQDRKRSQHKPLVSVCSYLPGGLTAQHPAVLR